MQHNLLAPVACTGTAEICFGGNELHRLCCKAGRTHRGWGTRPASPRAQTTGRVL
jgi:hypothetical protein